MTENKANGGTVQSADERIESVSTNISDQNGNDVISTSSMNQKEEEEEEDGNNVNDVNRENDNVIERGHNTVCRENEIENEQNGQKMDGNHNQNGVGMAVAVKEEEE